MRANPSAWNPTDNWPRRLNVSIPEVSSRHRILEINKIFTCYNLKYKVFFNYNLCPEKTIKFVEMSNKLNVSFQVEEKPVAETRGRIKFRLEYDFTLQELRVTVREINASHFY